MVQRPGCWQLRVCVFFSYITSSQVWCIQRNNCEITIRSPFKWHSWRTLETVAATATRTTFLRCRLIFLPILIRYIPHAVQIWWFLFPNYSFYSLILLESIAVGLTNLAWLCVVFALHSLSLSRVCVCCVCVVVAYCVKPFAPKENE